MYVNICVKKTDINDDGPDAVYCNITPVKKSTPTTIKIAELTDFIKEKTNEKTYFQTQFSVSITQVIYG